MRNYFFGNYIFFNKKIEFIFLRRIYQNRKILKFWQIKYFIYNQLYQTILIFQWVVMADKKQSFIDNSKNHQDIPKRSIKTYLQNKYIQGMLALALTTWTIATFTTWTKSCDSDKQPETTEINDSLLQTKYVEFWNFLETQDLTVINRSTTLWRYVRVARYIDHIQTSANQYGIPFEYLFALIMVESQGNTASINENDGWAGFIHFQPDVAKEYGMKIFTDNKKYKQYDFGTMQKQGKSKKEIYTKHGEILQWLMNKSMWELEQLDDRFHTSKCIDATAKYLAKIKKQVDKNKNSACIDPSRNVYKNDTVYNFDRILTLNGFNKWFGYDKKLKQYRFTIWFEGGSHVRNLKSNLSDMRAYDTYVKNMIRQGKSNEEIFKGLQTTKFI